MATLLDSLSHIDDGDLEQIQESSKTLNECLKSEYVSALQDFIYVIRHNMEGSNNIYKSYLYMLYEKIYKYLIKSDCPNDEVPELAEDINSDFMGKELLAEACFQFAIFYLCREYANISGCVLTEEVKNLLFPMCENKNIEDVTSKDTFDRLLYYSEILKVFYDHSEPTTKESFKKNLSPLSTINDFMAGLTEIINTTTDNPKKYIEDFNICNKSLLDDIAQDMFHCFTNGDTMAYGRTYTFSVGEGGKSEGFMGVMNLGLIMFNYTFDEENKTSSKISQSLDSKINENDLIHLFTFGYSSNILSNLKLTIGSNELNFLGSECCYNGIRPVRYSDYTKPKKYSKDLQNRPKSERETLNEVLEDKECTVFIKKKIPNSQYDIACFNRLTNNLNSFIQGSLKIYFLTKEFEKHFDEIFLIMNIVHNEIQIFDIDIENSFEEDKFEITTQKTNSLFSDVWNRQCLDQIINFLRKNNECEINPPIIEGHYVGKTDYYKHTIADKSIIPGDESSVNEDGSEKLRFSKVFIKLDAKTKKITIKIWSTTSPRRSNLKDEFKSPHINENKESVFNTEDIDKYVYKKENSDVVYYNQPLAMLRSMGVLEAIAKKLYRIEQTPFMKEKMKNMLNSAFAVDKSGEARGNDNADYQLKKTISYATYKSFKWYKDEADYNRYDHDINFDTTENNNN